MTKVICLFLLDAHALAGTCGCCSSLCALLRLSEEALIITKHLKGIRVKLPACTGRK